MLLDHMVYLNHLKDTATSRTVEVQLELPTRRRHCLTCDQVTVLGINCRACGWLVHNNTSCARNGLCTHCSNGLPPLQCTSCGPNATCSSCVLKGRVPAQPSKPPNSPESVSSEDKPAPDDTSCHDDISSSSSEFVPSTTNSSPSDGGSVTPNSVAAKKKKKPAEKQTPVKPKKPVKKPTGKKTQSQCTCRALDRREHRGRHANYCPESASYVPHVKPGTTNAQRASAVLQPSGPSSSTTSSDSETYLSISFTYDQVTHLNVRAVDFIPFRLRTAAGIAFVRACQFGWLATFAYAKLCLRAHPHTSHAQWLRRFKLFGSGDLDTLFAEATAQQRTDATPPYQRFPMDDDDLASDATDVPEELGQRVKRLVRMGHLSRASKALDRAEVAEYSTETLDALKSLHPIEAPPPHNAPNPVQFPRPSRSEILKALQSFKRGSAAGISQLSPDHLKTLIHVPGPNVLDAIMPFITHIVEGTIPANARPYFMGARLVALKKRCGGIRPIASGDTFRRIAAKVLCARHSKALGQELLKGGQCGVGIPGGIEAMFHATARFAKYMSSCEELLFKFDVKNAFNSLSRAAILQHCEKQCPALYAYASCAYGHHSLLQFGPHFLASQCGVQQGDPLGPLLFAIVLQTALDKALAVSPVTFAAAYLDDVVVGGSIDDVHLFFSEFRKSLRDIGLLLNPAKCETIGLQVTSSLVASDNVSIPHLHVRDDPWLMLGAPGNNVDAFAEKKFAQATRKAAQIVAFAPEAPHEALLLLRYCAGPVLVNYWLRLVRFSDSLLRQFDEDTSKAVQLIVGPLDEFGVAFARLPDGLCIPETFRIAPNALYASLLQSMKLMFALDLSLPKDWADTFAEKLRDCCPHPTIVDAVFASSRPQHLLFKKEQEEQRKTLSRFADLRQSRVLNAASSPTFLQLSHVPRSLLPPANFVALVRFRLGQRLVDANTPCPYCHKPLGEEFGDHVFACKYGSHRHKLHAAVTDALLWLTCRAHLHPTWEDHPFPSVPNLRLDVSIRSPSFRSSAYALFDVAITNSAITEGSGAEQYEKVKVKKYAPHLLPGQILIPFVIETSGRFGPSAAQACAELRALYAASTYTLGTRGEFKAVLSAALCKAVSNTLALAVAMADGVAHDDADRGGG